MAVEDTKASSRWRRWFGRDRLLLAACAFVGGAVFSGNVIADRSQDQTYKKLAVFARVMAYIENNYFEEVDADRLIQAAIRGMVSSLDTHSTYMDSRQYSALKSEAQGEFGGVGIELKQRNDDLLVVSVHRGSPAEESGVKAADIIVSIDGDNTKRMDLSDAVRRIKGAPGSLVRLGVQRAGTVRRMKIRRARIRTAGIHVDWIEPGVVYVRIRSFTEGTVQKVKRELDRHSKDGAFSGLVLDLRDNPGGLVEQAVRLSDLWISRGLIVSTEGRYRPPEFEYAHPKDTEAPYPIAIVVNRGTASASEIVAGALKVHGRAKVFGERTFGKGSVQTVVELDDGSALKLTIARYFTPDRRTIHRIGIAPDVEVSVGQAPIASLNGTLPSPGGTDPDPGPRIRELPRPFAADPQIKAALVWIRAAESPSGPVKKEQ